jgi:very-short-patch-repair endonuclease
MIGLFDKMVGEIYNIGQLSRKSWREKIRSHVRELRRNQTTSEAILWEILRNRKISGKKFYRQHPIIHYYYNRPYYFVADFYCDESKLIVEIDGKIHGNQEEYDNQRTLVLKELGINVLRIKNEELEDIPAVIKKIIEYL